MTDSQHIAFAEIAKYFDALDDPRCHINRHHPLTSVVVIAIMAILAGANGPTAIAKWARAKDEFLCQALPLPFGTPGKDVFRVGTKKAIAKQIVDCKADYLLALKGNQGNLHDAVIDYVTTQLDNDFANVQARQLFVTEKLHGQIETRIYTHLPVPKDLPMLDEWQGLKSIGTVVRCYMKDGKEMTDIRYYISSLKVGVKLFARAARGHWGIENSCHWTLDMTFREDESRIRGKRIRENFAWLNRLALSLLKQHPSKDSIAMKRRICAWDDTFLLEVLTGITA